MTTAVESCPVKLCHTGITSIGLQLHQGWLSSQPYPLQRHRLHYWQRVKPAIIVTSYDTLKSNSHDIYLGQDQGRVKNLHPPNISWIHDVNKTCFLHVMK